jgi:hypothetical protein
MLRQRLISAVVLLPAVLVCVYVGHPWLTLLVALCLGLVGWSAYNVGLARGHLTTTTDTGQAAVYEQATPAVRTQAVTTEQAAKPVHTDARVVASKSSSSKKYHYTWCAGATKIKAANQVWFATAQEAEAAGYTLAGNCTP